MSTSTMRNSEPIAAINVTPLVDVMLVLLIIFMITAPMLTQRLMLNLPQQDKNPPPPPQTLSLHIAVDGSVVLDGSALTPARLDAELAHLAAMREPPALDIDVDANTQYRHVIDVLSLVKHNGLSKIAFSDINR